MWEERRKTIRVDWAEFQIIWSRETTGNPSESFLELLILLIRHRFFFFVPRSPGAVFSKIQKKRAPEMIEIRLFKKRIRPHGAIW